MEVDDLAWGPAGVADSEAAMVGGVPVLGRDDAVKAPREAVGDGHHRVSVGHGESPTGEEVVLEVDEDEGAHGRRIDRTARKV